VGLGMGMRMGMGVLSRICLWGGCWTRCGFPSEATVCRRVCYKHSVGCKHTHIKHAQWSACDWGSPVQGRSLAGAVTAPPMLALWWWEWQLTLTYTSRLHAYTRQCMRMQTSDWAACMPHNASMSGRSTATYTLCPAACLLPDAMLPHMLRS
jgi:hypothetical protein